MVLSNLASEIKLFWIIRCHTSEKWLILFSYWRPTIFEEACPSFVKGLSCWYSTDVTVVKCSGVETHRIVNCSGVQAGTGQVHPPRPCPHPSETHPCAQAGALVIYFSGRFSGPSCFVKIYIFGTFFNSCIYDLLSEVTIQIMKR